MSLLYITPPFSIPHTKVLGILENILAYKAVWPHLNYSTRLEVYHFIGE